MHKSITLVTGSKGLLGNALRSLKPHNTIFLDREDVDLRDFNATKTLFHYLKPDRIIHLAAVVGGLGSNMIHSGEYFRSNIAINTNVLESARLAGTKKLISYMSTCVFPENAAYPLNEKDLHNGAPHPSNFGYAYAKRMLEVQSSAYRREWQCDYIIAIPTNMYGPHDYWSLENGHVVPSLIHKCYLAKKNKTSLTIWGSGKPLREFVFARDIAQLSLWALDEYEEAAPIILSSGEEISIRDLVDLIVQLMKFKGKVHFDLDKPDGQIRKPSDVGKLKQHLPHFKFTPIEVGLQETIEWFESHYPDVRL